MHRSLSIESLFAHLMSPRLPVYFVALAVSLGACSGDGSGTGGGNLGPGRDDGGALSFRPSFVDGGGYRPASDGRSLEAPDGRTTEAQDLGVGSGGGDGVVMPDRQGAAIGASFGFSSGGGFVLFSQIGQPLAASRLTGGNFELEGSVFVVLPADGA